MTIQVSDQICVHCNQRGHKKAHCPSLAVAGPVSAPSPATLRIIDGRQGRADAPVAKIRAFQMSDKEVHATLDVVMVMYLFLIYLLLLNCYLCFCILL